MLGQVASAVTMLICAVLAVRLGARYRERRRPHTLLYAASLGLAAIAAGSDFLARVSGGWTALEFRVYWFAAAGLVGVMGVGTGLLILPYMGSSGWSRAGRALTVGSAAVVSLTTLWLLVAALGMPVAADQLVLSDSVFTKAPPAVKLPFVLTSSLGAMLIFVGALWSFWKTRYRYNLLIALGALIFSLGGTAAALGGVALFYTAQSLGSLVLYAGVAGSLETRPAARMVT